MVSVFVVVVDKTGHVSWPALPPGVPNTRRVSWPVPPPNVPDTRHDSRLGSGFAKCLNVYADEDDHVLGPGWSNNVSDTDRIS